MAVAGRKPCRSTKAVSIATPANHQPLTPLSFLKRAARASGRSARPSSMAGSAATTRALFARAPARLGAVDAWRRGGDTLAVICRTPCDAGGSLRRADAGRRPEHDQHAARRRDDRLPDRTWRGQGPDRRPRVRGARAGGDRTRQQQADPRGVRRPRSSRMRPSRRRAFNPRTSTSPSSPWAIPPSNGSGPGTSGTRSRSTTRPAPPGNPKGVVYSHRGAYLMCFANTLAAAMQPAARLSLDCCRCSIATAGASPGTLYAVGGHACLPAKGS